MFADANGPDRGDRAPMGADLPEDDRSDDSTRLELRCGTCGYGVLVRTPPESCPMCKTKTWEPHPLGGRAGLDLFRNG